MSIAGVIVQIILFTLSVIFRKNIAALIRFIKLPRWILYFLTAIPFIIVEEHINCGAYHCTNVLIPPTLGILMIFELLLLVGVKLSHTKSVIKPTIIFSILGIGLETLLGGLVGVPLTLPIIFLVMPWVGISYAWVAIVPLTVLQDY